LTEHEKPGFGPVFLWVLGLCIAAIGSLLGRGVQSRHSHKPNAQRKTPRKAGRFFIQR
jgi:hypothetical protein